MRTNRNDFLIVIILLLFTIFTWRHIPTLPFQGEGFYYFEILHSKFLLPQDAFALLFFNFIAPIFKDQLNLYMYLLFIVMLIIDVIMYFLIRVVTESKLAAFVVTFLFSLSYVGNYDMYSSGGYQYFVQRGIILLPLLLSLMFLVLYILRNFQIKFYLISITLYLLSIIMGFFGTWFLPPFLIYPAIYVLLNLKQFKVVFLKVFWIPLPFLIGNYLLIRHALNPYTEESFLSVLLHNPKIIPGLIQQLAVITLPNGSYEWLVKLFQFTEKYQISMFMGLLMIFLYGGAFLFIWKSSPSWRIHAATAVVSLISILLLNLYLNSANVLFSFNSSRYFYYPFVMVSLFWGLFFAAFLLSFKKNRAYFLIAFCVIWIVCNNLDIQRNLQADGWRNRANIDTINYLRLWSKDLVVNPSYVYLPANLGAYGTGFAFRYFSHPDGKFMLQGFNDLDLPALAKEKVDPDRLYVLILSIKDEKVFDKTEESRKLLRELEEKSNE